MANRRILVLAGDGIGPEVMAEATRVARWLIARRGLQAELFEMPFGLSSFHATGALMPPETLDAVRAADAILFGAMGGDGYDTIPAAARRAGSVLRIRKELDLYANVRPVRHWPALGAACPLRDEVARGTDLVIVRENTGGLYFGEPRGVETLANGRRRAVNTQVYATDEIERVARFAFELARTRRGEVCSVDKSNVLESGALWRETVQQVHDADYRDVRLSHMLVDNCALQLVRAPTQFDVILTDNMFGDILSDGAGAVAGSLGMLPSASLGTRDRSGRLPALYEPIHGSAPDIEGKGIANPLGAILSFAMCLRHSFGAAAEARLVECAVAAVLEAGIATRDIGRSASALVTTREMGDRVIAALETIPLQA